MSKNDKEKKAYDEGPELLFDVADKQRKAKQAAEAKSEETKAPETAETKQPEPPQPEEAPQQAAEADPKQIEEAVNAAVKDQEDKYLRLAGRVRQLPQAHPEGKGSLLGRRQGRDAARSFLPVYDNLAAGFAAEDRRRGLCQGRGDDHDPAERRPGQSWASRRSPPQASPLTPTSTTP